MKKALFLAFLALLYFTGTVNAQEIIFVRGTDPASTNDSAQIGWLEDAGFTVTQFYPDGGLALAKEATLDWLNSADLVILGRSVNSSNFAPPNRVFWNSITAPVLQCSGWATRNSRANWFNSGSAVNYGTPDTAYANILMPADPIFAGVTLVGDSLDWMIARHSAVSVPSTTETNAEILARGVGADSNYVLVARFEPYVEFYPGSIDYPAGYYTYFGFGNDESGVVNTFPLTDNARIVYMAEIERLLALPEPATQIMFVRGRTPASTNDSVQIGWLRDQGYQVTEIPVPVTPLGEDTIRILNRADLVIFGRSVNSGNFGPPNRAYWNSIKAPVLQCSGWATRNSRANWFNSGSAVNYGVPDTAYANILMPADDIFSGVTLVGDSLDWMIARHSAVSVPSTTATNAEVLARGIGADSNYILVARFEPLVEFYPGSVDFPAGYCTYFGFGNDESGVINTFPLTDNARTVYLAEIERLLATPAPPEHIMFVQGRTPETSHDSVQIAWLEDNGYMVHVIPPPVGGLVMDTLTLLNKADLVILGRSVPSTTFQPPSRVYWNAIKAPVMQCSGWGTRNSRSNWFNSGSAVNYGTPDTAYANILMPGDEIFSDVTLVGDSLDWMVARHSAVSVPSTTETNAEILARGAGADSNYVLVARFDPLTEFYPESFDYPSGRCTYFGFGNDESGVINTFPLTDNARTVYLAEIQRMLADPLAPLSNDADLRGITATEGTVDPEFDADVLEYSITVTSGAATDTLTADAHPNATVTGDGVIAVGDTAFITVTADNGTTTKEYMVVLIGASSDDATLSDLKVDGETIAGFDPDVLDYDYTLAWDATTVPEVTVTTTSPNASADITPAGELTGTTNILVTAEDGSTQLTYTVTFVPSALDQPSLQELTFYPNPVVNTLRMLNTDMADRIEVYTLSGEKVIEQQVTNVNGVSEINVASLLSGLYIIRAYENENLVGVGKFAKQ